MPSRLRAESSALVKVSRGTSQAQIVRHRPLASISDLERNSHLVLAIDNHRVHGDGLAGAMHTAQRIELEDLALATALITLVDRGPSPDCRRHQIVG